MKELKEARNSVLQAACRIADRAAEELIRWEGNTRPWPDEFAFAPCQIDDHLRDCIDYLCGRDLAEQCFCDDGTEVVELKSDRGWGP